MCFYVLHVLFRDARFGSPCGCLVVIRVSIVLSRAAVGDLQLEIVAFDDVVHQHIYVGIVFRPFVDPLGQRPRMVTARESLPPVEQLPMPACIVMWYRVAGFSPAGEKPYQTPTCCLRTVSLETFPITFDDFHLSYFLGEIATYTNSFVHSFASSINIMRSSLVVSHTASYARKPRLSL